MKLIDADKVEQAIKDYWKTQVDKLPKPGNVRDHDDFVDRLNSYIEHNHELLKAIDELPSAQPDIIRCKDCEYLCNEDGLRGMCWHINGFGTDVKDKYNSFCSWAERREDG